MTQRLPDKDKLKLQQTEACTTVEHLVYSEVTI